MSLTEDLIKEVRDIVDRAKYYNEPPTQERLDALFKLADDVEYETSSDIENAEADGFDNGFENAKERIKKAVLENTHLKTRGEMIAALESIES